MNCLVIKNLKVGNFGKFNKMDIELSDGINIIYGENESGKSTLHSFIRAMFFGVVRLRGKAALNDQYTRFEPWENPAFYEGTMEFIVKGRRYRIDRVFQKNVKKAILTDLEMGTVVPMGEKGPDVITGFSEESFYKTVSVSQSDTGIEGIIANLNMSGSGEINVREALEFLSETRRNLERKKQALGIEETESRLKEYSDIDERINVISEKLEAEKHKLQKLEKMYGENHMIIENKHNKPEVEQKVKSVVPVLLQRLAVILPILALICGYTYSRTHQFNTLMATIVVVLADIYVIFRSVKAVTGGSKNRLNSEIRDDIHVKPDENIKIENEIISMKLEAEKNIERLGWELDSMTALMNRRDELLEGLSDSAAKKDEIEEKLSSVALAVSSIQGFSKDMGSGFGEVLNELASEYISRFTRGKYDNLRMDSGSSVTICEDGRVVNMNSVSYATKEQIHLSIRLAAAKLLFDGEAMPIILDEAFAHYDDNRLEDTLMSLSSMGTQVIIFTCTDREKRVLEKSGRRYNYIEL